MNFKDAAIKVLTENKKPLHYKKITSIALDGELLDFLGTSPEKRMLDSLKLEVKKKESIISVIRPGFFILKEYHNKNLKSKENKSKERLETFKEENKKNGTNLDEIQKISEYSKQIYSKQYFTTAFEEKKVVNTNKKEDIPQKVLDYMIKNKKVKYYSLQEFLSIVETEDIFDVNKLNINEIIPLLDKFNKQSKNLSFFISGNKIIPYSLIESDNLLKNELLISEELKNREKLINKEIINWFNRLNYEQFQNLSKQLLEKLGLNNIKEIKGFSEYHFLTQEMGLSELNFILLIKKGKEEINRQNIIEARGVLSRFGYGNLIILTSSKFDVSAIEEAKLNATNIILMDKFFIIKLMRKFNIGITNDTIIDKVDYNFFLSL
jgi:hypothetical protein